MDCGSTVDKSLRAGLQAKMWQHLRGKLVCGPSSCGTWRARMWHWALYAGSDFQPRVYCCKSAQKIRHLILKVSTELESDWIEEANGGRGGGKKKQVLEISFYSITQKQTRLADTLLSCSLSRWGAVLL